MKLKITDVLQEQEAVRSVNDGLMDELEILKKKLNFEKRKGEATKLAQKQAMSMQMAKVEKLESENEQLNRIFKVEEGLAGDFEDEVDEDDSAGVDPQSALMMRVCEDMADKVGKVFEKVEHEKEALGEVIKTSHATSNAPKSP